MNILDYCDIRDTIARYQWFLHDRKCAQSLQQSSDKGDEKKVKSAADLLVSSTKTSG